MFSFLASLVLVLSSMFIPSPTMDAPSIESSTNVDLGNPFTILDTHVDDLSYGEYAELARECYNVTTTDDDAEWCISLMAHEYPELGWAYYSARSSDRGEVTPIENEFFTFYDENMR